MRNQNPNWGRQRINNVWDRQQTRQTTATPGAATQPYAAPQPAPTQEESGPAANYSLTQDPGYQGPVQGPANNMQHPFFDPNSNYAQTGRLYEGPPGNATPGNNAWNNFASENPEGYYYAVLNQKGLGGLDARSQVAQGMYRDAMRGYSAAHTKNQALFLPEYLEQWDPNAVLDMLSEEQLGIDRSRFAGRDRWGMRGGQ